MKVTTEFAPLTLTLTLETGREAQILAAALYGNDTVRLNRNLHRFDILEPVSPRETNLLRPLFRVLRPYLEAPSTPTQDEPEALGAKLYLGRTLQNTYELGTIRQSWEPVSGFRTGGAYITTLGDSDPQLTNLHRRFPTLERGQVIEFTETSR